MRLSVIFVARQEGDESFDLVPRQARILMKSLRDFFKAPDIRGHRDEIRIGCEYVRLLSRRHHLSTLQTIGPFELNW